jgi:hypothetical protein
MPYTLMFDRKTIPMYTAIVLDSDSQQKVLTHFKDVIPRGWKVYAHHMTINLGASEEGPAADMLGQVAEMRVLSFGMGSLVCALGVESHVPSTNHQKHVTLAVNVACGGKARDSNNITYWLYTSPISLWGTVEVVRS